MQYFEGQVSWTGAEMSHPRINQLPDGLARSGDHAGCGTAEGVLDMMGNLHEWTADPNGTFRGGFYADRVTQAGVEVGREFSKIAAGMDLTPAQLAILWTKDQPGVTAPLIGPRTMAHLEPLLPVLEMTLPDDVRAACDALVPPGSVVADFHNTADWMKMTVRS